MKKYQFRLEQVRRVRATQEEVARSELLTANRAVIEAQQVVTARINEYRRANAGLAAMTSSAVFAKERFFSELACQSVLTAREAHARAQEAAQKKHLAWAEAAMKVKVLDRLDERKREEYAVEYSREVDKELDDIVTGRFGASQ